VLLKPSRNLPWLVLIGLATLVNFSTPRTCNAQALYGTLVGNVTDPSSAGVPHATVTILHKETGESREATTNDAGGYNFPDIATGTYQVTVTKEGFIKFVRQDVGVSIATVVRVDVKLEVGSVTETVQVTGQAEVLQTDRAEVRDQVTSETLENLVMPVYRNYQDSVFAILPGFAPPTTGTTFLVNPARASNTNVNGATSTGINWRIDGASATNVWMTFYSAYVPGLDSIQTVDVVTNSFDAEQGLAGGASVNVQIKSGTNALHGSAFEYHSDDQLEAKTFFLPAGQEKPKYILNQFGGTIGGPIVRNKLFYFLSLDTSMDRETGGIYTTVPTAAIASGNMSASPYPIYDPATGNADGTGRTPFPGNIVPPSRISPITEKIVTMLTPPPQFPGLTNNFYAAGPVPFSRYVGDAKVNWNATRKLSLSGRAGVTNYNSNNPAGWGAAYDNTGPGVPSGLPGPSWGNTINTSGAATYVASPHWILDGNFGWTSFVSKQQQPDVSQGPLGETVLGIPNSNGSTLLAQGWPGFSVTGYGAFGTGNTGRQYDTPQKNVVANGNWIRGAHNIRFGTEISQLDLNDTEVIQYGQFTFSGGITSLNGGPAPNQFNSYADFLLGLPSGISISKDTEGLETTRTRLYSFYVRDQWQASRKLTVSYGVRWEKFPLGHRSDGTWETYDTATDSMLICGRGNVPSNCGVAISNRDFSPRLGLAYRVSDTFVIRAGYGLNFEPNPFAFVRNEIRNYPSTINNSWAGPNSYTTAGLLSAGVPAYPLPDLTAGTVPVPNNVGVGTYPSVYPRGYAQNWNITTQKELKYGFVGQVGYVATRQVKQAGSRNLNIGTLGGGEASQPFFQEFGNYSSISQQTGTGSSHYDSLQSTLERRFHGGYAVRAAYTWSKVIGICCDSSGDGSPEIQLWQYRALNRAVEPFNRTQNLSVNGTADLPFGKGKKLLSDGAGSALAGGWKLTALLASFTGLPFSVSSSTTPLNCPGCVSAQRANQVLPGAQILGGTGPGQAWFNPLAFAPVTTATLGTEGYDSLYGPGAINLDMGLFREFRVRERWHFEIRGEALNATNTPHFSNPGANVNNLILNPNGSVSNLNGFATITSTVTRREGIDQRVFRIGLHIRF
jgi:hypothetical protein